MKMLIAVALSLSLLGGCAGTRAERHGAARGALIGAAGGAVISAMTGGGPVQGAAVGAAGGAAVGAITADGRDRRTYRDDRARYWTDDRNQRRYVPDRR